jgi:hypothetical protein
MLITPNLLEINDKDLLLHHILIDGLFQLNETPYEAVFSPKEEKNNPFIAYATKIRGVETIGFFGLKKDGEPFGAVRNSQVVRYVDQEGFDEEQIENSNIYSDSGGDYKLFFTLMCHPKMDKLVFFPE